MANHRDPLNLSDRIILFLLFFVWPCFVLYLGGLGLAALTRAIWP